MCDQAVQCGIGCNSRSSGRPKSGGRCLGQPAMLFWDCGHYGWREPLVTAALALCDASILPFQLIDHRRKRERERAPSFSCPVSPALRLADNAVPSELSQLGHILLPQAAKNLSKPSLCGLPWFAYAFSPLSRLRPLRYPPAPASATTSGSR